MTKRVIVVSDSHGNADSLRDAFAQAFRHGNIDAAVFLGDGMHDFDDVKQELYRRGVVCYAVRGNNDWATAEPVEAVFTVNGVCFFACHGHTRQVKYGLDRLWYAARERGAKVALYGHTHRERLDNEDGLTLLNPGAVCERSKLRSAYAEVTVEDNSCVTAKHVKWER